MNSNTDNRHQEDVVPDFMADMGHELESLSGRDRPGRSQRSRGFRKVIWLLAGAAGITLFLIVLAGGFEDRNTEKSLEMVLVQMEKRLGALESRMEELEKDLSGGNETPATNAASQEKGRYHKVRSGESLSVIAHKYGLTVDRLCQLNQMSGDETIKPDQMLKVSVN